jgi:DNA-binding winged helix-turn-helix (wHTH) protein
MVVGDHSVYQAVARLRKALGDNSNQPDYIETVSKRGYRLLAPVVAVDSPVMNDIPINTGARSSRFAQFAGTAQQM